MSTPFDRTLTALADQEQNHWTIGDALTREVTAARDWDRLQAELEARGLEYTTSTLKAYRRVAGAFPAAKRQGGVSFAAHQAALTAGVDNAQTAIDRAIKAHGKATRDTVLSEVRQMKGRATQATSDAVGSWRALRKGVDGILALPQAELEALLMVSNGTYAGQATSLSRDLAQVGLRISEAMAAAEAQLVGKKAKVTKATRQPKATPTPTTTGQAPKAKPRLQGLGKGRGE